MWFRYQSGRMLSEVEFQTQLSIGAPYSADTTLFWPIPSDYRIFLTAIDWALYIGVAATWVVSLTRMLWDESSYPSVISRSSAGHTAARWYGYTDPINVEVDGTLPNSGANTHGLALSVDEQTGTTSYYPLAAVRYRLIAP